MTEKIKSELVFETLDIIALVQDILDCKFNYVYNQEDARLCDEVEVDAVWLKNEMAIPYVGPQIYNITNNSVFGGSIQFRDYPEFIFGVNQVTSLLISKEIKPAKLFTFFKKTIKILNCQAARFDTFYMAGSATTENVILPPYSLPAILKSKESTYAFHQLPQYVTWLNFWSTLMLQNIDYKPAIHNKLFYRLEPLEHGTVFQLTEAPTDPKIPEHLARLLAVYEAFPKIGGRHLIKDMNFI